MSLPPGTSFGPYQIIAPLGAGGMGEVYRARDTRLDRDIALKTLPDSFANDAERLARFEREAKTLASLNHPHIAQVYAVEARAIVMELVEGDDLSERLRLGPIPVDEAIPIARQIAEALEAAHDAGIIHRDLKPANVKVRNDGTVKVLDFGLAKASGPNAASGEMANSPTITTPAMTMQGMVLGTAAYMSPEQAKGKFVDRRADIWAFGCVLYEMLTGKRTFAGEDVSDTFVSILRDDPRWAALPAATPENVRQLLRRCLKKDPAKRLPHIGVARMELAESSSEIPSAVVPPPSRTSWWGAAAAAVIGGVIVGASMYVARPVPTIEEREVVRFTIEPAPGNSFTGANNAARFAVSPDGREVVYQMQGASGAQLFVRALEATTPVAIPGAMSSLGGGEMQQAFWSPDGRYIAYFDEPRGQLKKLDRSSGLVQAIVDVPGNQLSGSWSDAGTIVFASLGTAGVRSVSADGGAITQATKVDAAKGETAHLWPDFLPDGRHFVYQVQMVGEAERAIFLGSLDGAAPVRLFNSQTAAVVALPDQLLFGRELTLMSQTFDMRKLVAVGEPRVIADQVPATLAGRLAASASRNGVLAYGNAASTENGAASFETYWVDRAGRPINNAPPTVLVGSGIRLSRDGRSLMYARETSTTGLSIWIQDTVRGIEARLLDVTLGGLGVMQPPVFSPDASRILYRQVSAGAGVLLSQSAAGTTPPTELYRAESGRMVSPFDWSRDGRILFASDGGGTDRALYYMRSDGDLKPVVYLQGLSGPIGASLSPDGRFVAYSIGVGPRSQIFVQSFPEPTQAKVAASGPGSTYPRWNPNGQELFYVERNQRLMSVAVKSTQKLEISAPTALFDLNSGGSAGGPGAFASPFDVMPDGERFVAIRPTGATVLRKQAIVVAVNWLGALR